MNPASALDPERRFVRIGALGGLLSLAAAAVLARWRDDGAFQPQQRPRRSQPACNAAGSKWRHRKPRGAFR